MSTEDTVQVTIREAKDILAKQSVEAFVKFLETRTIELEKKDQMLESVVLWHFFEETMEKFEEEDYLAYAYSKLISRYLLLADLSKAKEIYEKSIKKELSSFHLDTVRTIYERRTETRIEKEIVKIGKKDIFGDFTTIVTSPNVLFENNTQIRNFVLNDLPEGSYRITIFNHKLENTEELRITTETLEEYEVISVKEIVRVE